ncbi:efflux RND transporter periplasmic adaptor subunit [Limnobacter litoralis]|uniref:Transporter n=1 Tax=Limnobacter litoralis TaxID=481366 RepID=A0ABQ5YMJ1_9BURK|nr:efflux RND transporter periplasmic adaptor subunit [Limnobacter litoralis]GLR25015.1 transporter [Limnobacter litoralis]
MTKHPLTLRLTLLLLATLIPVLTACGPSKPEAAEKQALRKVEVSLVSKGPDRPALEATGVGAYRDEAKLGFKVPGVIEQIAVREGETVRKGQRLAWLNKEDVAAATAQASAGLNKARRDLKRGEALRAQEVISQVQLDDLHTAERVAMAAYSQASYASQTAEIKASGDAIVMRRFAQPGEVVGAGQPVLMLGSKSSGFVVKASLSDRQAVQVHLNDRATVVFDAQANVKWTGKVIELSQSADPVTGTYGVQVLINPSEHPESQVLSGMQAKLTIQAAESRIEERSYVPLSAVVEGDSHTAWLFVMKPDHKVVKTPVQVAFVDGNRLGLNTPLAAGTPVVSLGAAYLTDGEAVEVLDKGTKP